MSNIEQNILSAAVSMTFHLGNGQKLKQLFSSLDDTNYIIKLAVREGLAPLLYRSLQISKSTQAIEHDRLDKLRSFYLNSTAINLKFVHDLKTILKELNSFQIPVVIQKGIFLANNIYPDVGIRPMNDIDLWVLPQHHLRFNEILRGIGYQNHPIYPNILFKNNTILDINTHVLSADRIQARKLLLKKNQIHIYKAIERLDFKGEKALCLCPYDQFLYLSLHAMKHNISRLIWLVDMVGITRDWKDKDWDLLIQRAEEFGQTKSIAYIIFLLRRIFHLTPPADIQKSLNQDKFKFNLFEKKALKQRIKQKALPQWAPIIMFTTRQGLRGRVYYIIETLFPRPEILKQIFSHHPSLKLWQLYILRFFQLLIIGMNGLRSK